MFSLYNSRNIFSLNEFTNTFRLEQLDSMYGNKEDMFLHNTFIAIKCMLYLHEENLRQANRTILRDKSQKQL